MEHTFGVSCRKCGRATATGKDRKGALVRVCVGNRSHRDVVTPPIPRKPAWTHGPAPWAR